MMAVRKECSAMDSGSLTPHSHQPVRLESSVAHTGHVYNLDYVIACDAGRGRLPLSAGHFAGTRLQRSFSTVHRRAQDAARAKLHDAAQSGQLRGFVHAYLGMPDQRLPIPVADLIPAAKVQDHPTDFKAMSETETRRRSANGMAWAWLVGSHNALRPALHSWPDPSCLTGLSAVFSHRSVIFFNCAAQRPPPSGRRRPCSEAGPGGSGAEEPMLQALIRHGGR
jgi:hypothetical protein